MTIHRFNLTEDIKASFQPYYEITTIEESTDPNLLYDQKNRIDAAQVIWQSEVDNFAKVFFDPKFKTANQAKLNAYLDPAVERFNALPEDTTVDGQISQDDLKHTMTSFTRLYSFLSQIIPFHDIELEKLFPYIRLLLKKLPKKSIEERLKLDDEVALEYYRINKSGDGDIGLEKNTEGSLSGATEAGVRRKKMKKSHRYLKSLQPSMTGSALNFQN